LKLPLVRTASNRSEAKKDAGASSASMKTIGAGSMRLNRGGRAIGAAALPTTLDSNLYKNRKIGYHHRISALHW
jgi:hypothetical protein